MKARKPHGLTGRPSNRLGKFTAEPASTRSIYLQDSIWRALKDEAAGKGVNVNHLVRSIIEKHLARRPKDRA